MAVTSIALLLPRLALSSWGDKDRQYVACLIDCPRSLCPVSYDGSLGEGQGALESFESFDKGWVSDDFWLRLMRWDCLSECKYRCMRELTELREQKGLKVVKFYGKWPFRRVCGVQELFSSIARCVHVCACAPWRT